MSWGTLKLWAEDEEKRIHQCIVEALRYLISSHSTLSTDGELAISGKLRPFLYRAKKEMKLAWTLHPEASSFREEDDPKPFGHPDFRFSHNTTEYDQYDYDIECKLVREKRVGKSRNYCEHYVTDGVYRFQERKYAHSYPPMGTMIGYVQDGNILSLLTIINNEVRCRGLNDIKLKGGVEEKVVTHLFQHLQREMDTFALSHFWTDLR
ncbi:MAG: hypothetical protein ABIG63_09820 [Chloroflexota bacterium]